jgi:hypothetical protein
MDGLFFLLSVISCGLVMVWVVRNDLAGIGDDTAGLFAMR